MAFAKAKAEALAPGLDWEKPEDETAFLRGLGFDPGRLPRGDETPVKQPYAESEHSDHPTEEAKPPQPSATPPAAAASTASARSSNRPNYWKLVEQARKSISDQEWQAAKAPLQTVIEFYPNQNGPNNAYAMLATVHRELKELPEERAALEKWASTEADALDAYLRLLELAEPAKDWPAVALNAERTLAVNPLLAQPYRHLARASEALNNAPAAITAYEKQLLLDPADPADVHFRLGRLLHSTSNPAAKRHVLQALEEAPRFREAHRLLLELAQAVPTSTNTPALSVP